MFSKESRRKKLVQIPDSTQKSICWCKKLKIAIVGVLQKKVCNFVKKRVHYRCFPKNIAKYLKKPNLKNIREWLVLKISTSKSDFFYPLKPFSILNFATKKWLCHVTCFAKTFLLLLFCLSNKIVLSSKSCFIKHI